MRLVVHDEDPGLRTGRFGQHRRGRPGRSRHRSRCRARGKGLPRSGVGSRIRRRRPSGGGGLLRLSLRGGGRFPSLGWRWLLGHELELAPFLGPQLIVLSASNAGAGCGFGGQRRPERGRRARVRGEGRDPHAHGDPLPARERMRLDHRAQAGRGDARFGSVRVRKQDHEFLAGVARHAVRAARELLQELPEIAEHLVSDRLSVALAQRLEIIDVEHHDRELVAVPLRLLDFGLEAPVEVTFVVEGGDVVGRRKTLHLAAQDDPVHDPCDLVSHEREELLALLVERLGARVAEVDHPHRFPLKHDRHRQEGAHGRRPRSALAVKVVQEHRLPLLRDPGGESPPPLELHVSDEIDRLAHGRDRRELPRGAIGHEQRRVLERNPLAHPHQHLPECLGGILHRLHDAAHLMENVDRGGLHATRSGLRAPGYRRHVPSVRRTDG